MTNEETVVRRVLEQWALKDPQALVQFFADDGIYDNVPDEKPMAGHDAIRQWLSAVFKICRVEAEVLNIAANGEWVLSERLDTHIFSSGQWTLPVMNASRIVDGNEQIWRDYYCRKTIEQLGIPE